MTMPPQAQPASRAPGQAAILRLPNPMIAVAWLAIFVPGHLCQWWVERAFAAAVAVLGAFILFGMPSSWKSWAAARQASAFFFLIQFLFLFSFIYAIAFMGIETGPRDYFEAGRYLILWVFIVYVMRHYDDRVRRATETATAAMLYYSLFVALCYLRPVPVVSEFFRHQLYAQTKTFVNYFGTLRLAAPFENPNFLGFVTVQVLAYMLFFSRSPIRLIHCAAALLVVYFTGSRTAWVSASLVLAGAVATYAWLGILRLRLKLALQLGLALIILVGAGVKFSGNILKNSRMQALFSAIHKGGIQKEPNAAGRLEQCAQSWEYIKRSPILGWGPSKYATWDYVDNQYVLWGLRNGLAGALLIIAGLGLVATRLILSQRGDTLAMLGAATFSAAIAVELLTGEFLNNFRLFFVTWLLGTAIARKPR